MSRRPSKIVTIGGPVGLVLGVLCGALVNLGAMELSTSLFEPIGQIWMNALRVAVVPLTVCLLVVGVCSLPRSKGLGRIGGIMFAWFAGLLLAGALLSVFVTKAFITASPPAKLDVGGAAATELQDDVATDWTEELVPSNIVAAAAKGDILPLAVVAVLFGLALRNLPEARRKPVEDVFVGIRDAVMVFVGWAMLALPLGAFALMFTATVKTGLATAGAILQFVLYATVLLAAIGLVLAAVITVLSRAGVGRTMAALGTLVSVAVGTRSSIASLPTLVKSAEDLGLHEATSEIVLPTSVAVFKMNRTITSTAKLLFMAAMTGTLIGPHALAVFVGTVVLLSFATPGLPGGGSNITTGAYLAAGVPLEAIVVFETVDAPTDPAKTALNVLADLAVALFVSRAVTRKQTSLSQSPSEAFEERPDPRPTTS